MKGLGRGIQRWKMVLGCDAIFLLMFVAGCGPRVSSPDIVREFEKAGPIKSETDLDSYGVTGLKSHVGPYRVIPGDILEFQMPAVLRVISSDLPEWLRPVYGRRTDIEPYLARISPAGTITLPIVGEMHVAGRTLAQIEASVIDAYHPKYVVNPYSTPHKRVLWANIWVL